MSITNFPAQLQPIIQSGMLARFLEEGLDSELASPRQGIIEKIPGRIGQTLTMTRSGRKPPVTQALNAQNLTAFDNGLTPTSCSVEQYLYTLSQYGDTVDTDISGEIVGVADQLRMNARNSGVQAAQSVERIAKNRLFAAYATANTFVRTDLGSSTTTTCHVDDIRGFQLVPVNGQLLPVSSSNPLTVFEVGAQPQTLSVTAAVADAVTASVFPSDDPGVTSSAGISGTLTFASATAPVAGDGLSTLNAPKIIRSSGAQSTAAMNLQSVFNYNMVQQAVMQLKNNAIPTFPDGTYHLLYDNLSQYQLFQDPQFQLMAASRFDCPEYKSGMVFRQFGVTFIPTTEAYVMAASAATVTAGLAAGMSVHRPILMGAESLLQGNWEGLELWLNRESFEAIGNVVLVDGIAQIIRPPLDRLQRMASISWTWVGDFAVPTDITATAAIIPTASNALYKRCVVMEHAG